MPMRTILVSGRGAASAPPAETCPTISAGKRFRTSPMAAVAQKPHPIPQPAWVEMQRVSRSRAPVGRSTWGMSTLSIAAGGFPSAGGSRKRSFRVPSLASATTAGSRRPSVKASASRARSARGKLDIAAKSAAPLRWTQARICAAR